MGVKSRPELTLIILLMAVLWLEAEVEIVVHCPSQALDWDNARKYCREKYIDLFTPNIEDINFLTDFLLKENLSPVWIGLHEDPEQDSVWKWINVKTGEGVTGEDVSKNITWGISKTVGSCGSYSYKKWYKTLCSMELRFLCFDDNLLLVTENKTWEEALSYCRSLSTSLYQYDLLSLTNSSDYSYVRDRIFNATTDEVWTGLRFLGDDWWWTDGEMLDDEETLSGCPNQWKHCGTLSKSDTNNWITRDCSERRNFICSHIDVA